MKNYRETSPTKIDSILCAIVVAVAVGAVCYSAIAPMFGSLTA